MPSVPLCRLGLLQERYNLGDPAGSQGLEPNPLGPLDHGALAVDLPHMKKWSTIPHFLLGSPSVSHLNAQTVAHTTDPSLDRSRPATMGRDAPTAPEEEEEG